MDKFRDIFVIRLAALELPLSTMSAVVQAFDQAKEEYWAELREELRKKFRGGE